MRWFVALAVVLIGCVACGGGPSNRPDVAVEQHSDGGGRQPSSTTPAQPKPADPQVPKTDLGWRDCTRSTLDQVGLGAGPDGLILECAEFTAPVDGSGSGFGTFTVGALRARLPQTPAGAAPLVLTSGADRPSTQTLAGLASGPVGALLASRPIVAIDRRGIGTSTPIDCIKPDVRAGFQDNAQFTSAGQDPAETMANLSQAATISCKDFLQPQELSFDAPHAADDLEQLRMNWQVDSLGILATGNGAKVALSYASKHPEHVGRLVLDSPEGVNTDATGLTESRVQGAEAALVAYSARCVGLRCALGPDPRAVVQDLVRRAGAGQLGTISANALLTAVSGFLGSPRADQPNRVTELADALDAARNGDTGALAAIITREQRATESDGEFVARCTDGQQWPAANKVRELQKTWNERYPVFGGQAATAMLQCSAWPVAPAPAAPRELRLPVLLFGVGADPVVGNGGMSSVTGAVNGAGGRGSAVSWQGYGHPATAHSGCAQQATVEYLKSAALPANGTACPA